MRLKVSYKDITKIPTERFFGVQRELYKILIKVEPVSKPTDPSVNDDPPPPSDEGMPLDFRMNSGDATEDRGSQRSSRTRSDQGSGLASNIGATQNAIGFLRQVSEACDEVPSLTSLLKSNILVDVCEDNGEGREDLDGNFEDSQCFRMLR